MRFSTLVLLVPACVVAAMIAVANREETAFTLVPFVPRDAGFTFAMPLFLLVFAAFILGVLVGAVTVALTRANRRARRRLSDQDIARAMMTTAAQQPSAERIKP
ncbi:MAG TPA: hypothetical protein VN689_02435 [Burkholderiales bacterium]|jgi:MFS superfamily sulfate permease-like transporter|nr:hypothetical protein [Burkholderiales bacterium]